MKDNVYNSLVQVYKGSLWEAELVKGLLESAGIEAMIKDDIVFLWYICFRYSFTEFRWVKRKQKIE